MTNDQNQTSGPQTAKLNATHAFAGARKRADAAELDRIIVLSGVADMCVQIIKLTHLSRDELQTVLSAIERRLQNAK